VEPLPEPAERASDGPTRVVARRDGSLDVRGALRIYSCDGNEMVDAGRALLCRCGQSSNKPFGDSSHGQVGFRSRPAETASDRLEAETPGAFARESPVPDAPRRSRA
jgi:CDGSH-type Zn-finger protein